MRKFTLLICLLSLYLLQLYAYNFGDVITNPDGSKGVVFWVNPDRSGGWMLALNNEPDSVQWGDTIDVPTIPNTSIIEIYEDTAGYAYTNNLRQYFAPANNYAANKVDFENGWCLPTATQLGTANAFMHFLRPILLANGGTDLGVDLYWTSTEYNKYNVIIYHAQTLLYYLNTKQDTLSIRAVRSFSHKTLSFDTTSTYLWSTGDTLPYIQVTPPTTTTYGLTVTNKYGCTQTAEKTIFVGENQTEDIYAEICAGEEYNQNGFNESTAGTHTRLVTGTNGCSLTINLHLTVNLVKDTTVYDTIYAGQEYNGNGFYISTIDNEGDYIDTHQFETDHGCDSTVVLQLHVLPPIRTVLYDAVCQGSPYLKDGFNLPEQRMLGMHIYERVLTTMNGCCDSTLELHLQVNPASFSVTNANICKGDTYTFNGVVYDKAGIYAAYLTNMYGCDSIATLRIQENKVEGSVLNDTICQGDSFVFNGSNYTTAGTYIKHLTSFMGCDSTATLKLFVKQTSDFDIDATICQGESYVYNGNAYYTASDYPFHYINAVGCDSLLTLHLHVIPPVYTTLKQTIAKGETYLFNGQDLTESGVYTDTLLSAQNCDSILILELVVSVEISVPEVFTPNKDGSNDYFVIKNIDQYPHNKILIFNRWGNKVWEGGPYLNNWDGTNQFGITVGGNDLPVGTYFYILDLGDGSEAKKGFVYLNR